MRIAIALSVVVLLPWLVARVVRPEVEDVEYAELMAWIRSIR